MSTPRPSRDVLSPADRTSFARLQARLGGRIGLAVSGLGQGQQVERLGAVNSVIAWSTSKVPIAMAIYDAGLGSAQQTNLRAAIAASDNAAAERLWAALGGGTQAAATADAQLRAAGDNHTQIQPNRLRPDYTEFGQTLWKLTDQARFTAGMACPTTRTGRAPAP
jgi:beta-lactamase class A